MSVELAGNCQHTISKVNSQLNTCTTKPTNVFSLIVKAIRLGGWMRRTQKVTLDQNVISVVHTNLFPRRTHCSRPARLSLAATVSARRSAA